MRSLIFILLIIANSLVFADSTQYCSGKKQSCCVSPSQGLGPLWVNGDCSDWWSQGYKFVTNSSCKKTCSNASFTSIKNIKNTELSSAGYMRCQGIDSAGNNVYLIANLDSSVVNINGDILRVIGKTRNGQGVVTEKFLNVFGVFVYDSIVPVSSNGLTIYQFNAVTEALLAQAMLSCSFSNTATSNGQNKLIEHQIFNFIKENSLKTFKGMPFNK
jgi:hypothetical protein